MLRSSQRTKPLFAAAVATALVAAGGAAWAAWRVSGSRAVTAAAGSAVTLQLTGQPRPNVPLFPGVKTALKVTVKNDNTFRVRVTSVRPGTGPVTADTAHRNAGCVTTGVSLTRTGFSVTWQIPAKSTREFQISNAVQMTNASHTACQGATFSIPLAAVGRSDA